MLPPLLTTADEDAAAEEEAASARAAGAEGSGWSIAAVGNSPLTAQRCGIPPIACPPAAPAGALLTPHHGPTPSGPGGHPTPGGTPASFGAGRAGALARTTSAATTAFCSIRSESSLSGAPTLHSPRPGGEPAVGSLPRSSLLAQLADAGSLAAAAATTPGGEAGSLPSSLCGSLPGSLPHVLPQRALFRQLSDVAPAAGSGAYLRSARLSQLAEGSQAGGAGGHAGMPLRHPLWRQPSDVASLAASTQYATPRGAAAADAGGAQQQTPALLRQVSSISQAQDLTGFDLSGHDGTAAAAGLGVAVAAQQLAEQPLEAAPPLQPQLSCLSQALSGFEGSVSGGLRWAACKAVGCVGAAWPAGGQESTQPLHELPCMPARLPLQAPPTSSPRCRRPAPDPSWTSPPTAALLPRSHCRRWLSRSAAAAAARCPPPRAAPRRLVSAGTCRFGAASREC